MPTEELLCMLCQVNPVDPGKKVCTACWQLAPSWVKRTFMKGEQVDWSRLLESNSNSPLTTKQEEKHGA
ncbi:MAG TPA: hypothetical protein VF956_12310 [Candidatus Dormibacteraeota bacterium]